MNDSSEIERKIGMTNILPNTELINNELSIGEEENNNFINEDSNLDRSNIDDYDDKLDEDI